MSKDIKISILNVGPGEIIEFDLLRAKKNPERIRYQHSKKGSCIKESSARNKLAIGLWAKVKRRKFFS